MRPTWLEIDLARLGDNYRYLRGQLPIRTRMMAVIKADAYGHGAVAVARALLELGCRRFAVATAGEGAALRAAGIEAPLHLLGNLHPQEAAEVLAAGLIPTLASLEPAQAYAALGGKIAHLKIDTGMHRVGVSPADFPSFLADVEALGIKVEGIMTHFASSDQDPDFTKLQLERFLAAAGPYRGGRILHAANSAALLNWPESHLDLVRPGIALYGLHRHPGLAPILTWQARATQFRYLPAGEKVGYGGTYQSSGEWMATLPLGYADGFPRGLSSRGWVRLGEQLLPVRGRVSMDQITVTIPGPLPPEAVFTIAGADYSPASLSGMAEILDTIPYETVARLSPRLPRVYK